MGTGFTDDFLKKDWCQNAVPRWAGARSRLGHGVADLCENAARLVVQARAVLGVLRRGVGRCALRRVPQVDLVRPKEGAAMLCARRRAPCQGRVSLLTCCNVAPCPQAPCDARHLRHHAHAAHRGGARLAPPPVPCSSGTLAQYASDSAPRSSDWPTSVFTPAIAWHRTDRHQQPCPSLLFTPDIACRPAQEQ